MPTGTTPRTATPHGKSLKASMEQLQISKPLLSGAQAEQQEETLRMQQQQMLQMQVQQMLRETSREQTQLMRQQSLQQMRQIMQEEMGTDTLTTSPFGTPVDDQWMQLEDLDEIDEATDKEITQFIDHITKKILAMVFDHA